MGNRISLDNDEKFQYWMSKVEHQLQMMLKKSPAEFDAYNYQGDYLAGVKPEVTAIRVIRRNSRTFVR